MRQSFYLAVFIIISPAVRGHGQSVPTASCAGNLQVGATFGLASPDYTSQNFKGFGFYSTLDFRRHLGIEAEFHQLNDPDSKRGIYERTYEIGPRYVMHFGRLAPYAKLMVGRGVFNFPPAPTAPNGGPAANLACNMWAAGFGTDYQLRPYLNVRADYEFQQWPGFPPNGLSPRIFSIGVAYHFH